MNKEFCESCNNIRNDIDSYDCGHNWIPFSEVNDCCDHIWISVKDRLPELGVWVLCNGRNNHKEDDNALLVARVIDNGESLVWLSAWGPQVFDVTHWMKLPLPPIEYCKGS